MLLALPMIAATVALAGPSHATSAVFERGAKPPACRADFGDNAFVVRMPKTPAYGANGLLRLVATPVEPVIERTPHDQGPQCVVEAQYRR